ncbi:MAG: hypothetical protein PWQ59_1857 [Thermoanaerobacterium sp.]|nr:hypothetical protein [Thermoanaerobacterium sp.]
MLKDEFYKTAASTEEVLDYIFPYLPTGEINSAIRGAITGGLFGGFSGAAGGALSPSATANAVVPGAAIAGAGLGALGGYLKHHMNNAEIIERIERNLNSLSDQARERLMTMTPREAYNFLLRM